MTFSEFIIQLLNTPITNHWGIFFIASSFILVFIAIIILYILEQGEANDRN